MKKLALLLIVVVGILVPSLHPAFAQGLIPVVYVDENRTEGNEDGSQAYPYNTEVEGIAYAQSLQYGGYVHVIYADGTVDRYRVESVGLGAGGIPLPRLMIYILLALVAVALLIIGWWLRQGARQLRGA